MTLRNIKAPLRKITPAWLLQWRRDYLAARERAQFTDLPLKQVFTKIYEDRRWGKSSDPEQRYYSGVGSHEPAIVSAYTEALGNFLASFERKPDVVDLGCGDFSIGAKIRHLCGNYVAGDIVEPLIAWNRQRYDGVDFRVLDITRDALPAGDVVFIRQVLQHLSNAQILAVLPKITGAFKYLVLTEHLPVAEQFPPNLDKPAGPNIRLSSGSGIIITQAPFNLPVLEETRLCEAPEGGGIIRTMLYRLAG